MLLSPPPDVLEKSGCCNAVTEAKLLSLVHTSAQNGKYAFHERGGWLNQRDVLCNIIPTRQLKPIVMAEMLQIVPGVLLSCQNRCKIARSEGSAARLRPLRSPLFLCSRGRVGARARRPRACVRVYVFLCRTAQYRDKQSRQ